MSEERISRKRFIWIGTALGAGAAGGSLAAACGGSGMEDDPGTSGSAGPGVSGDSGEEDNIRDQAGSGGAVDAIASESGISPGSATTFTDAGSGNPAVLVRLDSGDFVAYSAVCTHQACEVTFQEGTLNCPCHGSVFDPAAGGSVINGPAETPLPEIPVEVRGGEVFPA